MAAVEESKSYVGNGEELDPEAIKLLRLERVGSGTDQENLDVFQRMEKKGVPTADVIVSAFWEYIGTPTTCITGK